MQFKQWLLTESIETDTYDARQQHKYDCGSACVFSIAKYYGIQKGQKAILDMFAKVTKNISKNGIPPKDIIKISKKLGLNAKFHNNCNIKQLKQWIDEEKPVIVAIQAWGESKNYHKLNDGHYVIAIGYNKTQFIFEDPSIKGSRGFIPAKEFEKRWQDREANGDKLVHGAIVFWMNPNTIKHHYEINKLQHIK